MRFMGEGEDMRLGMSMMSMTWGITRMEVLLERMSGERGRRVEFRLFIPAFLSLSLFFLVPSVHSHFGRPRRLTNEQKPPIELPATSPNLPKQPTRFLPLRYTTNMALLFQDSLVLINPPQPVPPTSAFSHLFPIHFFPVFY